MIPTPSDGQQAIDLYFDERSRDRISRWCLILVSGCWLATILSFAVWITAYGFKVDTSNLANTAANWPSDSSLTFTSDRPSLLLFLHPKCPCSKATLTELETILSNGPTVMKTEPNVVVVASVPGNAETAWADTSLIKRAAQLANANLYIDSDGVETARFGVTTSGTVMLFDNHGKRAFSGGITISRGHEGRSIGGELLQDRLVLAMQNGPRVDRDGAIQSPPVFGCALCTPRLPIASDNQSRCCSEAVAW
ncbi:RedB [Rhodopirellula maiorica SM1]|uniref:RedB n=1 Tax=Rhodopirellula maiorica SM1 TaxID=1265738 RepID=M5RK55_9BACT|nr:hypothetical protein [Rhodopirellula maiorica]EMI19581.1 RedB [Rhodopirellula maiorica SM1]